MIENMNINDFVRTSDLYDKGVVSARQIEGGNIEIIFDLFHCDDPERDDETKRYLLKAIFSNSAVDIHEGDLFRSGERISGQILKLDFENSTIFMGIEWIDYSTRLETWCELAISEPPLSLEETLIEKVA